MGAILLIVASGVGEGEAAAQPGKEADAPGRLALGGGGWGGGGPAASSCASSMAPARGPGLDWRVVWESGRVVGWRALSRAVSRLTRARAAAPSLSASVRAVVSSRAELRRLRQQEGLASPVNPGGAQRAAFRAGTSQMSAGVGNRLAPSLSAISQAARR